MLGSSQSVAGPNIALNTIMAQELRYFADNLENTADFDATLQKLVWEALKNHQRIIFNGNGYSQQWQEEAANRGLSNLPTTADALAVYKDPKNIKLFRENGIFTEEEFRARYEIHMETYKKIVHIEGSTAVDMVLHQILPAAIGYTKSLCDSILKKEQLSLPHTAESNLTKTLSDTTDALYEDCIALQNALSHTPSDLEEAVHFSRDTLVTQMQSMREKADLLETLTDKAFWPYPTYSDLLFY